MLPQAQERRIDDVVNALKHGDTLLISELSRDGTWYVSWRDEYGKQHMKVTACKAFMERLKEMKTKATSQCMVEYNGKPMHKFRHSFKTACERAVELFPSLTPASEVVEGQPEPGE